MTNQGIDHLAVKLKYPCHYKLFSSFFVGGPLAVRGSGEQVVCLDQSDNRSPISEAEGYSVSLEIYQVHFILKLLCCQLVLLPVFMSRAHSPTFPSVRLCHSSFSNPSIASPTSQLILQPFHQFAYVTAHSPTLQLLHLHHSSFSNPSIASPTSQFILQPFFRFSYITSSSLNSPGKPPMEYGDRSYL